MLKKLTDKEFNEFSQNHPLNIFFQSSYWGDLKEFTGWKKHMVGIKEDGKIKGASLILSKKIPFLNKSIFYAPRGFLLDYSDFEFLGLFVKEVTKYIKKQKGIFLKINPYIMCEQRDTDGNIVSGGINNKEVVESLNKLGFEHNGYTIALGSDLEPRWVSVLNLTGKTEETVLNEMRPTTRWGVLNSHKRGLKLVDVDENRISEFKLLMKHTSERRDFLDRPLSYYKKMYECFKKDDNIKIMLVELDTKEYLINLEAQKKELLDKVNLANQNATGAKGKRMLNELQSELDSTEKRINEIHEIAAVDGEKIAIAGGLFMTFGTQVISLFGASYRKYMKFNGQFFLNFEMIKYALKNNYEKFNFLGITGEFNKESDMYGLFDFKRGFNADVVELIGEFNYIVDKKMYWLYQTSFKLYRKIKNIIK